MKLRTFTGVLAVVLVALGSSVVQAKPIRIQVNGMVCAFCAQGIEKKFKAMPQVEALKVSLETKKVDLEIKEGATISDEQIKKIVTEAGYEVVKIERSL